MRSRLKLFIVLWLKLTDGVLKSTYFVDYTVTTVYCRLYVSNKPLLMRQLHICAKSTLNFRPTFQPSELDSLHW
jgi:hypothetical protein